MKRPDLLVSASALLLWAAVVPSLDAQEDPGAWATEAELGAAVFFGNTSQTTVTTRLETESADSAREIALKGQFAYGEATNDEGEEFVNKRSWKVGANLDHRPFARWSPFVFGDVESAFERRIELRYSAGAGAKYLVHRSDRGRLDVSAAILGEQTNPSDGPGAEEFDDDLLARWSFRGRARRSWDEGRLTFDTQNFYQPRFDDWDDFTMTSTSSLAFALNETISLKLTFVDNYDSEAELRGARTNNDGQLFVSLLGSF